MKSGYVWLHIFTNSRIWAAVDSYGIHEGSLHLENVKVCCFTPSQRTISPIFFEGTVDITERLHIFPQLVEQLDDAELMVAARWCYMPHIMKLHGNDPDLPPGSSNFKRPVVTTITQLIPSQFLFSDYLKDKAIL
jgi:hypothetical protein